MENMGTDVWVKRVNIKLPFRRSYMKDSKPIHLNSQKASQQLKFHPPTQGRSMHLDWNTMLLT